MEGLPFWKLRVVEAAVAPLTPTPAEPLVAAAEVLVVACRPALLAQVAMRLRTLGFPATAAVHPATTLPEGSVCRLPFPLTVTVVSVAAVSVAAAPVLKRGLTACAVTTV